MKDDLHVRAAHLVAQQQVESITPAERDWLHLHLADCQHCAELARSTDSALQSLRTLSVALPAALASRTQLGVYLRAREMRDRDSRRWALWIACGVSWAVGAASAPYVWRGFEWIGHRAGVPSLLWQTGFVLWWGLPALVAAGILLLENSGQALPNRE